MNPRSLLAFALVSALVATTIPSPAAASSARWTRQRSAPIGSVPTRPTRVASLYRTCQSTPTWQLRNRARLKLINDPREHGRVMLIDMENLDPATSRGLEELLLEELAIALDKADDAVRRATAARELATTTAAEADSTAAAAAALDPGFAAHYPDASEPWALVNYTLDDGGHYSGKWRVFVDHGGYRAHGLGVFDADATTRYRGEFRDGRPGGVGVLTTDRRRYQGTLEDGLPSGFGVDERGDNWVLTGKFLRGVAEGSGRLDHRGTVYFGEFVAGRKHGFGRLEQADGKVTQGLFRDGVLVHRLAATRRPRPQPPTIGALRDVELGSP